MAARKRDLLFIIVPWILVGAAFFLAPEARAGGIEVPDLDPVALGRGAAFVAKADTAAAFYYNPAGLSKRKGPHLLLGGNLANMNVKFKRIGDPENVGSTVTVYGETVTTENPQADYYNVESDNFQERTYSSVKQKGALGISSAELIFTYGEPGGIKGLGLAAGIITPSGYGAPKYPSGGSQRYVLINSNQLMGYLGVGLSYAVNRYFQIGGVFLMGVADIEMNKAVRLKTTTGDWRHNENKGGDATFGIHTRDWFMPTGIFGVLSNPLDWLEIGVSVKLPAFLKSEGKITKFVPPSGDAPEAYLKSGKDNIGLDINLPMSLRAGARYIHRIFDVEVDFVWENWSTMQRADVTTDAEVYSQTPFIDNAFPKHVSVPLNFRDTYSARLGGDVDVWRSMVFVRAGYYYQSSAYPENYSTFSVFAPFGEQHGLGFGVTYKPIKYLDVNLSYLHVFQEAVVVKEGLVHQMALPADFTRPGSNETTQIDVSNVVNTGKYEVSVNMIGVSLEGHF